MDYRHDFVLYQTVTPLHVGCGQDIGVVDLPVFRERTTAHPLIPGSGIRGALRSLFERSDDASASRLFGPRADEAGEAAGVDRYAGSIAIHDAKLLLYPVRADQGLFLWVTCPAALARMAREGDVFLDERSAPWRCSLRGSSMEDERFLGPEGLGTDPERDSIHLEEFRFHPVATGDGVGEDRAALESWARRVGAALGRPEMPASTVLVANRTFTYFARHATMVLQRNALDAAKTVREGALFSLEAVPPEAVFFGFLGATSPRWQVQDETEGEQAPGGTRRTPEQVLSELRAGLLGPANGDGGPRTEAVVHLGGNESVGLGVTRLLWPGETIHES